MNEAKAVSTSLAQHFRLSATDSPKDDEEEYLKHMSSVPYTQAVGSIMYYLMVSTRPDLAYAASMISRYMANPGRRHWEATKWTLRYLKGTQNAKLLFKQVETYLVEICGYVDSDYADDLDKRRSLSGYIFLCGGNLISRESTLQSVVALSSTKAEFIALLETIKEGLWLKDLLNDFGITQTCVRIYCDNQSVIYLSKNQQFHSKLSTLILNIILCKNKLKRSR